MTKDRILLMAMILLVGILAIVFFGGSDPSGPETPDLAGGGGRAFEKEQTPSQPQRHPGKTVSGGGTAAPVENLPPADPVTTRDVFGLPESALEVTVLNVEGQPFPRARVSLFRLYRGQLIGARRGETLATMASDDAGRARFDALESRLDYMVHVDAPGFRRFELKPVQLSPGEVTRIRATLREGYRIRGRITADSTGSVIAGARITAWDLTDPTVDEGQGMEVEALSDEQGNYVLKGLRAGPKRLCVVAGGFGGVTRPHVQVTPAQPEQVVDFSLPSGRSIEGQVLDLEDRPIPDAVVTLFPVKGSLNSAPAAWYPPGRTDSAGRFRIDGLLPGLYTLRAMKPGYAPGNFSFGSIGPGPRRLSMANARPGDDHVVLYLGPGPSVAGRVIDGVSGRPLKAFDLYISSIKDPRELDPRFRQRFVDSEGRFDYGISVLSSQERILYLHARAPGFAGGRVKLDFASDKLGMKRLLTRLEGIEIVMEKGVSLTGRVVTPGGEGIAGALVQVSRKLARARRLNPSLINPNGVDRFSRPRQQRTKEDGTFEVTGLVDGDYRLVFDHEDWARLRHPALVTVEGRTVDVGTFTMHAGGTVSGTVLNDNGRPEEGAGVELAPAEFGTGQVLRLRTGLSGRFSFTHVPSGDYRLMVVERNGLDTRSALYQATKHRQPQAIKVHIEDGLNLSFDLRP